MTFYVLATCLVVLICIHMMMKLVKVAKRDSNINNNVSVVRGGRRIGAQNDTPNLLKDHGDRLDTVLKPGMGVRPHVTTNFRGVIIRLYDMVSEHYYDVFLDKLVQIGRTGSGCDIEINDLMVSSKHCAIFRKGNEILIQDLGSRNHTYVNEIMLDYPVPLSFGDIIRLGTHGFQFQYFDVQQ